MNIDSRYEGMSKIGEGGMAVVYRAHDTKLGRDVAIKVIAPQYAGDAKFRARFMRELKILARLQHPNIVPIYDSNVNKESAWFAMRFIEGENLRQLIEKKEITAAMVLAVGQGVLAALEYAHRNGVIHRDVKPENIFISREGEVFLVDFGIACATDDEGTRMTRTGMALGTPAYSSPEQLDGLETTAASDQYSFGIVLYEMISGQPPFTGSLAVIIAGHLGREVPVLPRSAGIFGGKATEKVIRRMLEKDAAARYRDCDEARVALSDCFPESIEHSFNGNADSEAPKTKASAAKRDKVARADEVSAVRAPKKMKKKTMPVAVSSPAEPKAMQSQKQPWGRGKVQKPALAGRKSASPKSATAQVDKPEKRVKRNQIAIMGALVFAVATAVVLFVVKGTTVENGMIRVNGGKFMFGENASAREAGREVALSDFLISKYEITQREYETVMNTNPGLDRSGAHPVENVAWIDAVRYCNERSKREHLQPVYNLSGNTVECDYRADGYRLPTEAEWEYAARGGEHRSISRYAGSDRINEVAVLGKGHEAVGRRTPNRLGLYDMSGNVREWCQDGYAENPRLWWCNPVTKDPDRNAVRIVRGGGWNSLEIECAVFHRMPGPGNAGGKSGSIGFRVVRGLQQDRMLLDAVRKADVAGVRKAIADGARPKYCADEEDDHVLKLAVTATNDEIVKLLLEAGADANFKIPAGFGSGSLAMLRAKTTPILADAAWTGSLQIVKALLEKGANVNDVNSDGVSPLHAAVKHEAIVDELLKNGATVGGQGTRAGSHLQMAVSRGILRVVRKLLDHGADPNDRDIFLNHPVLASALTDDKEAIARLLIEKGADLSVRIRMPGENRESYYIDIARRNGQYRIVRLLQRYNAPSASANRNDGEGAGD
ncbi:MAG TPA: SUMF1/EgtB/PvdO family nonheme iron enzyme [Spirochaetota bacterium]|nr:SUMF1/EgtB/PvdO family nonheme iron enzyme [Spirochaetota bacterium]